MNDRELIEMAAKAAGMEINQARQAERDALIDPETAGLWIKGGCTFWNPLTDDANALRLAVKLNMLCDFSIAGAFVEAPDGPGPVSELSDYRRAITRAAAEIGKAM